ncbi:MAG: dihydrodipicolinate reductase [Actinobacteria bacterium]|nr:dihydrodipicolinate reductase [Actinomycetota bacterium]MBV9254641.1 dihydrodipicolinate reductase [Actinomycetota bacterium]MBV9665744.1 dihydrodipicolinate reductase [Actinomycetota bacterium]MBV9934110.1 dihydrodipicolinate reductase [Actinomycetota bacterium]
MQRYRVAQWATGNIGTRSLRAVIEHPQLELVGVYVYSDKKAGVDAGELCGAGPTGVVATTSIEDILAAKPDCVLYMPRACDYDDVCRLLEGGANVVTTRGEFHRPASMDADVGARVEAACAAGGTSIHSTGSSPGFISEALPLVLSSLERRIDCLTIDEFADVSSRNSPELLFDLMGFGQPMGPFDPGRAAYLQGSFGPSLELLADAIGLPLDALEASGEFAVARHTTQLAAGTLEAGTIGGQRITVTGLRDGKPLLRFRATWYCTADVDADWDMRETGWRVTVEGDTPLAVDIRFPVEPERWAEVSPGLTAHRAVNAVAAVCEAIPGIRTTLDLPHVVPVLS